MDSSEDKAFEVELSAIRGGLAIWFHAPCAPEFNVHHPSSIIAIIVFDLSRVKSSQGFAFAQHESDLCYERLPPSTVEATALP